MNGELIIAQGEVLFLIISTYFQMIVSQNENCCYIILPLDNPITYAIILIDPKVFPQPKSFRIFLWEKYSYIYFL
ncbi:hypothetical protein COU87_03915 [Candidatus Roizmanbacteria bacterium CG10_big_fil_rev_8_21_14_0_10_39_12]|uniref:Uncharacterized protein n=1 Tax=Candidatus Roizmanbacteria bacterium CG10_big_fil_rev_8_21_14_0_10_39_12 TaxID=1974852 RepID=A0A2M8KNS9_9BACT|nr:MAG: hypothetical protein COY15_01905 [Candidatus Roizmanbacteria bacterium CG_4_10_14_0_2_um_filter_39_12]PJE61573.1 MAG: hypothetical protein COU87_03915 [Candidatus Roizmanbacteria bacterium CG10_big_fil_rev_8_21_14_0_10_39_12]